MQAYSVLSLAGPFISLSLWKGDISRLPAKCCLQNKTRTINNILLSISFCLSYCTSSTRWWKATNVFSITARPLRDFFCTLVLVSLDRSSLHSYLLPVWWCPPHDCWCSACCHHFPGPVDSEHSSSHKWSSWCVYLCGGRKVQIVIIQHKWLKTH